MLDKLGIPNEVKVVSAHRTPDLLFQYAEQAEGRGIQVIIAGAGGAAHLPGMCAALHRVTRDHEARPCAGLRALWRSDAETSCPRRGELRAAYQRNADVMA